MKSKNTFYAPPGLPRHVGHTNTCSAGEIPYALDKTEEEGRKKGVGSKEGRGRGARLAVTCSRVVWVPMRRRLAAVAPTGDDVLIEHLPETDPQGIPTVTRLIVY